MAETNETAWMEAELKMGDSLLDELLPAFHRLDRLLERAVLAAQVAYGPEAMADPFRGLHIGLKEVEQLLAREPGAPVLQSPTEDNGESAFDIWSSVETRLVWLAAAFDLSPFDLDLILIALAPEVDLRYERLYAYLQDDVSRRRPSVDLALNLLCPSAGDKLERRSHFAVEAPLVRQGLMHLIPDPNQVQPPLLAHYLKLDDQIVDLLLGQGGLDARLDGFCELTEPAAAWGQLPLRDATRRGLLTLVQHKSESGEPLVLYFHGSQGAGKRQTVEALARELGMRLLAVDLPRAAAAHLDWRPTLRLLFREAWLQHAIPYLAGLDVLRADESSTAYQSLLDALSSAGGISVLAGTQPWTPAGRGPVGAITVSFPALDHDQRRACWREELAHLGATLDAGELDAVAGRFRLLPGQIADAAATAQNRALWRADAERPGSAQPALDDLFAAARAQSGHDLAALARKIEPNYTWDDIVLPEDSLAQLRELCQRVAHGPRVLGEWGFDRKLSLGKGVTALFAGPSGTGKTMAAEIIASELGLDLYKIDLSGVVSKYIGETEKNLERIFQAAEDANAILFFDEADALFGKRSEVRDSHDRYANVEISYLLQRMEQYGGIAILATNLRQNLDDSFVRRLAFIVHFPFPDEAHRLRIWQGIWPSQKLLGEDVALDFLALQFKLSGGNIKNIALSSAFLASADGGVVNMDHLFHATHREYQKLGKTLSAAELHGERKGG